MQCHSRSVESQRRFNPFSVQLNFRDLFNVFPDLVHYNINLRYSRVIFEIKWRRFYGLHQDICIIHTYITSREGRHNDDDMC